jgi:hypothetical protein
MDRILVVVQTKPFSAMFRQGKHLLQALQVLVALVALLRPLLLRSVLSVTPNPFAFVLLLLVVVMLALMATILTFDDR